MLTIKDILNILPHRYPFLLVDKIVEINVEKNYVIGQKNVSVNEAFFQGHFPESPIMPGVLILEALAQTGSILVHANGHHDRIAVLLHINNAKFRHPVRPGDILMMRCESTHISKKGGRIHAVATVDDKVVVDADIAFALVEKSQI